MSARSCATAWRIPMSSTPKPEPASLPQGSGSPAASMLRGRRVLVTGGAGFIGSHIADRLAEAGCGEVVILDNMARGRRDNLPRALVTGRVTLVEGDLRDARLVERLVEGTDTVFHQAALRITQCAAEP